MYHSVSNNIRFTNKELFEKYNQELINIGDKLLSNIRFGLNININKAKFIRIKNLMNIISDEYYKDTFINNSELDTLLNKFNSILIS